MKSNELRIGNLVDCFGICEVISIYEYKIKVRRETDKGNFLVEKIPLLSLELKPVPLTEGWFLKSGAEIDRGVYRLEKMKGYFNLLNLKGDLFYEYNIHQVQMCKIKYVHELQNLYYPLTNQSLIIKL